MYYYLVSSLSNFFGGKACFWFASANLDPGQIRYVVVRILSKKTAEPQLCSSVHIHKIYFYGV